MASTISFDSIMRMTGSEIRQTRVALGLSASRFATVLGVHPSTVHRWESAGQAAVTVEGIPLSVLLALQHRVAHTPHQEASDLGKRVAEALLVGGALAGLVLLIGFALKDN